MKTLVASAGVMWLVLAIELAIPGRIPRGALILPIACSVIFWTRSAAGIILSGVVLLIDVIARQTFIPLCPMLLPFIAVWSLAPSVHHKEFTARRVSLRVPLPLHLPLMTLAAVALQSLGMLTATHWLDLGAGLPQLAQTIQPLLIIALPVSAVFSLLICLADELGMRRTFL